MIFDLIKLGGSVLTDKGTPYRLRDDVVSRLAREVADGIAEERWQSGAGLVIVHGAGSFGHPRAAASSIPVLGRTAPTPTLQNPPSPSISPVPQSPPATQSSSTPLPSLRQTVVHVQAEVRRLHLALLEALVDAGVPAVSLPGAGFLRMQNGRLERPDLTEFLRATSQGLVPVTCGDVILDASRGPHVVSGDRVMMEICRQSEPERVTFVTDVDGVYDRNPADPEARLLSQLCLSVSDEHPAEKRPAEERLAIERPAETPHRGDLTSAEGRSEWVDVTGGMEGKLDEIRSIVDGKRSTFIVSGLHPGRLEARLRGAPVVGTAITTN